MESNMMNSSGVSVKQESFSTLIDLMQMLQSDDNEEIVSKMKSVIKNEEEISDDGNSETAAAETAESEIENAEKKKMEGGEE